ncbi:polynucleotide kinase-phosphatase [Gordonia liuliyuniae]|uniref:Polynucleotide kinase-phosphatase n=1 Tax=Gordonia liuliyuniae TaxID=2911517 RepID=A0ABS9ISM9_9ACTN|nr:polynucleotide kinase-phosphatase [Gordonia liuliyuniae]MCF8588536.1 polynucleotide kinase-phosphatase [Gordonia liuliyuniae]
MADTFQIGVPEKGLVLLVGTSGAGKSTFARRLFGPTQVVSSDTCRAMVADDENDLAATPDAFDLLHHLVGIRLRRGLLTVVDATNVQRTARASFIKVAKDNDVLVDAVVLDVPQEIAVERTLARDDRDFGAAVIRRQHADLQRSLKKLRKEGFRKVHHLRGVDAIDAATVRTERSWSDRTDLTGPFDVIGDVHGCAGELRTLLVDLGYTIAYDDARRAINATHPDGRTAVFVGDLVDRGPDTPGVVALVMGMVEAGNALCVAGNHDDKLARALRGRQVTVSHGLAESLAQFDALGDTEFRSRAQTFLEKLISHYVLDSGRLVVAHAGLAQAYHGRSSARVRAFALYGDTTGETDEFGLPVRYPWADEYRGSAVVVYGHTPTPTPEWINDTICIDTGVVFGGSLTALRYPERELVSVPADREWYAPTRPLAPVEPARDPSVLRLDDVAGTQWIDSPHAGKIKIPEENAAAALEVMSRFAVDPRWLAYLPPTMSPASTSTVDGFLEHPEKAFDDYLGWGVDRVICEEKHMGSRAVAVLATDSDVARRRFGVSDGSSGAIYTRTGRPFFTESTDLVDRLRTAMSPLFTALDTDWLVVDCELLPWSAKALPLITAQYASVGAAARATLPAAHAALAQAADRGLDVAALSARTSRRFDHARAFRDAYAAYCEPGESQAVRVAPFAILAAEGRLLATSQSHEWQMATLGALDDPLLTRTRHRSVDLTSTDERAAATRWWLDLTAAGGEGMVVKPADVVSPRIQPGLKVRGREYLRIIYGPDYTDSLDTLRSRSLGRKRSMATREHGLGLDALAALVDRKPLWEIHRSVFAVLALESEPVDPRL